MNSKILRTLLVKFLLVCFMSSCASLDEAPNPGSIPSRSASALSGTDFARRLRHYDETGREQFILRELRRGNLPDFLRQPKAIRYPATTRSGKFVTITLWVLPDYLAVGENRDFVRVPMNPITAQYVADSFGYSLPTTRIVDEIYRAAPIHLAPKPFKPSKSMVSVVEFVKHDLTIRQQLNFKVPSKLLAGHKKDVVISNLLNDRPNKLAIYGWHQLNGVAIQPLSTVHGNWYADYSHGIRLISNTVQIDNQYLALANVLQNPELAPVVSYEGALSRIRYRTYDAKIPKTWWPRS
ncbi:MAG: hypothetical protein NTX25_10430 [Proteobacteria bacterium]|nr:hypothetical protein [Pseudomonadota bacterium]